MSSEFWNHVFLIVGTCIGGGITILPAVMSEQGCLVGIITLTAAAIFSISSSLIFLELFFLREEVHFFSLFRKKLPTLLYLAALFIHSFICFSSLVAYSSGMASELANLQIPGGQIGGTVLIVLLGMLLLGAPRTTLLSVNAFLVRALFICFFSLLLYMVNLFDCRSIFWVKGGSSLASLPICLTSFSHQMIIPSIRLSSTRDDFLKPAIVFGVFTTWLIYVAWVIFSFGVLPLEGENSLVECYQTGTPMTISLFNRLQMKPFALLSTSFSLLVMFTSFLGISLSFIDFLRDWLQKSIPQGRSTLSFCLLLLSSLSAIFIPKVFLYALNLSGGLGDASLYGLLPVYLALQGVRRGLFQLSLLGWQGVMFLFIIGTLSIGSEVSQLFFYQAR
ncbi:aromatic amino acid transport family protein [Candidatus Similichlamydia epinepheli]|uniref:aromatic amino acid transport family protein n=1 Tax=Candidatus Similichlamydia epinepheli TaxID=1903953 RepID=UPI0019560DB2|nr:aromatic amino acid transport family protein [Candidatus Similichlamydia epinepheli]